MSALVASYVSRTSVRTKQLPFRVREQQFFRNQQRDHIYAAANELGYPQIGWSAHRLWQDLADTGGLVSKKTAEGMVRKQGGKRPKATGARRLLQIRLSVIRHAHMLSDLGTEVMAVARHDEPAKNERRLLRSNLHLTGKGANKSSPPQFGDVTVKSASNSQSEDAVSYGIRPKSLRGAHAARQTRRSSGKFGVARAPGPVAGPGPAEIAPLKIQGAVFPAPAAPPRPAVSEQKPQLGRLARAARSSAAAEQSPAVLASANTEAPKAEDLADSLGLTGEQRQAYLAARAANDSGPANQLAKVRPPSPTVLFGGVPLQLSLLIMLGLLPWHLAVAAAIGRARLDTAGHPERLLLALAKKVQKQGVWPSYAHVAKAAGSDWRLYT